MSNNSNPLNNINFLSADNRLNLYAACRESESHGWGPSSFLVPPPDHQRNSNASVNKNANTAAPLYPPPNFLPHVPPASQLHAIQESGAYFVNQSGRNSHGIIISPIPYFNLQNPNVYNQVIINNTSHTLVQPSFPPSVGRTVGNKIDGVALNIPNLSMPATFDEENKEEIIKPSTNVAVSPKPSTEQSAIGDFDALIQVALQGCKLAEGLAGNYQKRPCFKKIDSLCANLQIDLAKSDNVMANINSQGLAWAVKDFIFVFTRIMNAWIIIKGYVKNQPTSLVDIRNELCPNFLDTFGHWHMATYKLIQSLIKSFVKLDKLAKSQRGGVNGFARTKQHTTNGAPEKQQKPEDPLNQSTESHHHQVSGKKDYLRTGVYETVKAPPGFSPNSPTVGGFKIAYPLNDPKTAEPYVTVSANTDLSIGNEALCHTKHVSEDDMNRISNRNLLFDSKFLIRLRGEVTATAIINVLEHVFALDEAKYFFVNNFIKNYFPDFNLIAPKCIDLRTILTSAEMGSYGTVEELVADLRQIVDACKNYLSPIDNFGLLGLVEAIPLDKAKQEEIENISKMRLFVANMELIFKVVECGSQTSSASFAFACASPTTSIDSDILYN